MYVVLAWFARRPAGRRDHAARAAAAVDAVAPPSYRSDARGDATWGLYVRSAPRPGPWPAFASADGVTAVSLGLPIGLDTTGGPVGLARRVLAGADPAAGVLPPFGLIAAGPDGAVTVAQDWLGMSRLFTAEHDGVVAFASRPSLLAGFLYGRTEPDPDAWESYAASGHFGADSAPVRGVRLLAPGARYCLLPGTAGWRLTRRTGRTVDDLVAAGLDRRGDPDRAVAAAADGIAAAAAATHDLCGGDLLLGLSGGKDSRVLAAAFVGGGRLPRLRTNADTPAEGATAERLVALLRGRGLDPAHELVTAAAPAAVLRVGLRERGVRLLRHYDHQFPSTYLVRPAVAGVPGDGPPRLSLTGAGGELATGYWYPTEPDLLGDRLAVERAIAARHLGAAGAGLARPARERQRDRLAGLLRHAADLGVAGADLADYVYLTERMRRWSTSAYAPGMVTPFLAPAVVTACFALPPALKLARRLHTAVVARFVPEWADVPYVSVGTGRSTAARIWQGDGAATIRGLLAAAADAPLAAPVRPDAVRTELARYQWRRRTRDDATRQFVYLALADRALRGGPPVVRQRDWAALDRLRGGWVLATGRR
ncbi:hypothetical protein GCM10010123_02400 [Pilimelia anulata]|uniref:Uncharacterized protein n=1 Tax=Pilimelia anulata TaxID=53371 RepID=A0A8J3B1C9_9ACTN|nr:hypothetical protein [Pilimelia anulata]GGJ75965.1 hypothetical protein GCM10010123_02400 [Pilimelia anulata]